MRSVTGCSSVCRDLPSSVGRTVKFLMETEVIWSSVMSGTLVSSGLYTRTAVSFWSVPSSTSIMAGSVSRERGYVIFQGLPGVLRSRAMRWPRLLISMAAGMAGCRSRGRWSRSWRMPDLNRGRILPVPTRMRVSRP